MGANRLLVSLVIVSTLALWSFDGSKAQATLWQDIGIGADWGPHWSPSPSAQDVRDTVPDGAFPGELCLIRNAGLQTVRMYGEPSQTWISLLDAVKDYNDPQGSLSGACHPGGSPAPGTDPMSIVYQVAICGPDPRTLEVNGELPSNGIDGVKCYDPTKTPAQESNFKASVDAELVKLDEILRYQKDSFKDNVKLALVGNEILFSRGVCSGAPGTACTQNTDCTSNQCEIGHFCSDTLSQPAPTLCTSDVDCSQTAHCTDVTNAKAIQYAFGQVKSLLEQKLGSAAVPPISISLQGNVLTAPALAASPQTPLWSRQQFVQSLPSTVVAVNIYPDQWGLVPDGSYPASDPTCMHATLSSCLDASNAVEGNPATLLSQCTQPADQYTNSVTGSLRNSVDDFYKTLKSYYPGYDIVIAETGWHTDGACLDYNDCNLDANRYSPGEAAKYYASLYQYVKTNQIPLLSFEQFDQETKVCTTAPGVAPAEANYGIFQNYCQLKGGLSNLLPSNGLYTPDLTGFDRFLQNGSCENQTVWSVAGTGNVGVCSNNPAASCQNSADCGVGNRCVWGHCENDGTQGCNPGDPNNPAGCGACLRAGNCYSAVDPVGYFAGQPLAACWPGQACPDVCTDFMGNFNQPCKCYVAMAPGTASGSPPVEGADFAMKWSQGAVELEKPVQPIASVVPSPAGDGFIVQPVWARAFVSAGANAELIPDSGDSEDYPTCSNSVDSVTPGIPAQAMIDWTDMWQMCHYPPGVPVNGVSSGLDVFVPRTFGGPISTFPRLFGGTGGTTPPVLINSVATVACDMITDIEMVIGSPDTPDTALKPLGKAVAKAQAACGAELTGSSIKAVKRSVAFLEKAAKKGANVDLDIAGLESSIRFATLAKIKAAAAEAGTDDKRVQQAQRKLEKALLEQDPTRAIKLFRSAYKKADKAASG